MLIPMKVDYGVRMLVHLASQPGDVFTTTSAIANRQHIPEPFLLRVSADLAKSGFIESRRGPGGGVRLAMRPDQITVGDVAESVDHSFSAIDCIDSPDSCMISNACSQRELWADIEQMLQSYLRKINIMDLASKQEQMAGKSEIELKLGGASPVAAVN